MKEALYYTRSDHGSVVCQLCPHGCIIKPDHSGVCRLRKNVAGTLYAVSYGRAMGLALDPIEKKPLYHFYPLSQILSLGPNGCNFSCVFCQNWHISQVEQPISSTVTPEELVTMCRRNGSIGLAYTYTEPFVWFEFVADAARLAHEHGLKNVLVTNGYVNQKPLLDLLPFIDAMNIDLKSMDHEFYSRHCGGTLQPVLDTIALAATSCHVEVTNLVIPTLNDSDNHFHRLAAWLGGVSKDIPLHFSRYLPHYRLKLPATPEETLRKARDIALEYLHYVFVGNVFDEQRSSTICPHCNTVVIRRDGYHSRLTHLKEGRCTACGSVLNVIMT